jgi:hypothetical protein
MDGETMVLLGNNMKKKSDWEYVGGHGFWTEYKNIKTGESTTRSLGKLLDLPKVTTYDECDHYFELSDPRGNNAQCQKCGLGHKIVWGIDIIKDGKLIKNTASKL